MWLGRALSVLAAFAALPFHLQVKPATLPPDMPALPALHSFSFAQEHGVWVFVGGRTDGNHFNQHSFPLEGANRSVQVINRLLRVHWKVALPAGSAFSLAASNAQFHYDEKHGKLYILGGYGASSTSGDGKFITFDTLSAIDVKGLLADLERNYPGRPGAVIQVHAPVLASRLKVGHDERVRLAGGRLEYLPGEDRCYLFFGH